MSVSPPIQWTDQEKASGAVSFTLHFSEQQGVDGEGGEIYHNLYVMYCIIGICIPVCIGTGNGSLFY
jgi:hypothetical protein